jgi:hypothetical protein
MSGTARNVQPDTEVPPEQTLFLHRAMATPFGITLRLTGPSDISLKNSEWQFRIAVRVEATISQLNSSNAHFITLI